MAARPRLLHAEAPDIVSLSDSELADALNEEMRSLRKLNAGVTYSGVAPGSRCLISCKAGSSRKAWFSIGCRIRSPSHLLSTAES